MNYNSPFIRMLETIANMLIVSFLWLIFSLPVITLVSSSCALYHTTNKIIFGPGRGNGVWKDFFESYKLNLIPGIKLTLLVIVAGLFVAEGLWTGYQIYKINIWGMLYMLLGVLVFAVVITTIVHIPPILSRFYASTLSIVRMAAYFAMKKPLRSFFYLVLFLFMVLAVESFPLALLIVPGLYADLVRTYLENDLKKFIEDNELQDAEKEEESEEEEEETISAYDIEEKLSSKKGNKR